MEFNVWWVIPVFVISLLFGLLVIPSIVRIANRMHLYDPAGERKVHVGNIPRLGGITFLPAIALSMMVFISVISTAQNKFRSNICRNVIL